MAAQTVTTGLGAAVDLVMAAGATNRWRLAYGTTADDGTWTGVDLTDWVGRAQFRRSTSAATALLTVTPTVDADGWVTCTVPAGQTESDVWQGLTGVWDIELTDPTGEVFRLAYGRFTCEPQVTR